MGQSPVKEQGVAGMHFDLFLSDLIFHCAGKQIQQFPALPCNGFTVRAGSNRDQHHLKRIRIKRRLKNHIIFQTGTVLTLHRKLFLFMDQRPRLPLFECDSFKQHGKIYFQRTGNGKQYRQGGNRAEILDFIGRCLRSASDR